MDMFHDGTCKLPKFATEEDVISNMPDNVITNVLDRLAIQDAVKTSVLSKNWRLKWTLLTKLVFDLKFFNYLLALGKEKKYSQRDIIGRLLLHLKGPISKFVLYILTINNEVLDGEDIYHWVLFLSRRGCKELTLSNMTSIPRSSYELPTQIFSCTELKLLKLRDCCFRHLRSFSGLPNLLSLELCFVTFESYNWWEFVTQCPLIEILKIHFLGSIHERVLNRIAKLINLKTLDLTMPSGFSISEFNLPPKLQELTLWLYDSMSMAEAGVITVPTAFLCLKTLTLTGVDFNSDTMVSFVSEIICGSPNLQTFRMTAKYENYVPLSALSSYFACGSMGQLQLRIVEFAGFRGSENEVYLIKSLLACSPLLKNISIKLDGDADGKFLFANKLLKLYRSSPMVEIDIC